MKYTVWYKKTSAKSWQKLENVKGDGLIDGLPYRMFILEDETRVEVPMNDVVFKFSPERFVNIKMQMEQEAGQNIPTKDGIKR